jgi:hypothetical protein
MGIFLAIYRGNKEVDRGKERVMSKKDDIDDQVLADWEFARRAQQLMSRLRTLGKIEPQASEPKPDEAEDDGPPEDRQTPGE